MRSVLTKTPGTSNELPVIGAIGGDNLLHYKSLLYIIETSKDPKAFYAVLARAIGLAVEDRLYNLVKLEDFLSCVENQLKHIYLTEIVNRLTFEEEINRDAKAEEQMSRYIDGFLEFIQFEKILQDLYQLYFDKLGLTEILPFSPTPITKTENTDKILLPILEKKSELNNFTDYMLQSILNSKYLKDQSVNYYQRWVYEDLRNNAHEKEFRILLKNFAHLLWRRIKERLDDHKKSLGVKYQLNTSEFYKVMKERIKQELITKFFDFSISQMRNLSAHELDKIFNIPLDKGEFLIGAITRLRGEFFKALPLNMEAMLDAQRKIIKSEILFSRWKTLLKVETSNGNLISVAIKNGCTNLLNKVYSEIIKHSTDTVKMLECAILCGKDLVELKDNIISLPSQETTLTRLLGVAVQVSNTAAFQSLLRILKLNINDRLIPIALNQRLISGFSPLTAACCYGDLSMIEFLHRHCAADLLPSSEDALSSSLKTSALYCAIEYNQLGAVRYLINNIKKDTPQEKENFKNYLGSNLVLERAIAKGNPLVIELLKNTLKEIHPDDNWDNQGQASIVNLPLVQPKDLKKENKDDKNSPPLIDGIFQTLIEPKKGFDFIQQLTKKDYDYIKLNISKWSAQLNARNSNGETPLLCVIKQLNGSKLLDKEYTVKSIVVIKLFVKNGADSTIADENQLTPINLIVERIIANLGEIDSEYALTKDIKILCITHLRTILELLQKEPSEITLKDFEEAIAFPTEEDRIKEYIDLCNKSSSSAQGLANESVTQLNCQKLRLESKSEALISVKTEAGNLSTSNIIIYSVKPRSRVSEASKLTASSTSDQPQSSIKSFIQGLFGFGHSK